MKIRTVLLAVGFSGIFNETTLGADAPPSSASPPRPSDQPSPKRSPASSPAGDATNSEKKLPVTLPPASHGKPPLDGNVPAEPAPSLANSLAVEKAVQAHIKPRRVPFLMPIPPPPLREERKMPSPSEGHVWKPGHWKPVDAKWQWTAGEWGIPPTPVSVWIEGSYDPAAKQWSAGYWQPDRAESYEIESPQKAPDVRPKNE